MTLRVFCVVEGHGDVFAFPLLIRRIAGEIFGVYDVEVERPYRLPKDKISRIEDLRPILELGVARLGERAADGDRQLILVTRDADKECPVLIASALQDICNLTVAAQIARAAIADEEFEAWLLAGAEGFIGHRDCREGFALIEDADAVVSPKGAFELAILKAGRSYAETVDQPKFAALMKLDEGARSRSRSLRHLVGVIESAILR